MQDFNNTQFFSVQVEKPMSAEEILEEVYIALTQKGYNPVSQLVGYIMSGDPTYVTSFKGARSLVQKVERDELLEVLLSHYITSKLDKR